MGGIVDSIFGGGQAKAIKQGTKAQVQMQREANALIKQQYDTTRADLAPYRDAGIPALKAYLDSLGLNGIEAGQASLDMFQKASPTFQFGLDQGTKAINNNRAVRGLYGSGSNAMALSNYATDYANQQFGNWQGKLGGLVDTGQSASALTGNLGANAAAAQAQGLTAIGNTQAAGLIGAANARASGINNMLGLAGNIIGFGSSGGRNWFGLGGG